MHDQKRAGIAKIFELRTEPLMKPQSSVVRHQALRIADRDQRAGDIPDTRKSNLVSDHARAGRCAAADLRHEPVRAHHDFLWFRERFQGKCANRSARRLGRKRAVTEPVNDEEGEAARILLQTPGVTALDFALDRDADRAVSNAGGGSKTGHDDRAFARHRMNVELGSQPAYGSETRARGAGRGITVPEATLDVVHAGATIDGQKF